MPTDFSVERVRLVLLVATFALGAFLVITLPPRLIGPAGDKALEMFLFITGGLAVTIVASPILAPHLFRHVLSLMVSRKRARMAIASGSSLFCCASLQNGFCYGPSYTVTSILTDFLSLWVSAVLPC